MAQSSEALARKIAELRLKNTMLQEALEAEKAKNANRAQHCETCVQRHHCKRRASREA